MESMRRAPSANWTPPWECAPDVNPPPDHPNRYGYIPAFFSHPTYDPTAAERPVALLMDAPMFLDYYALVSHGSAFSPRARALGQ
eukprot:1031500-Pyramimonas_sp.AAC.1